MVPKSILPITNPYTIRSIKLQQGGAMPDHLPITTDGNTMCMFYSKTGERSPIRALSMQSWHQKITIGATTATDLFSPNTETLESIVDIKTLSISQVDAHVNCVSHLLTVSFVHGCNWIKTTVCFQVPDHRVYLGKTAALKLGQRHNHIPE